MNYITWLYFLEDKENNKDIFLYGLSLPTKSDINETKTTSIKISKKVRIVLFTTISKLTLIQNNNLSFNGFMGKANYHTNIIDTQNTILVSKNIDKNRPYSILGFPIYISTYYTQDVHTYIDNNISINELNIILEKLSTLSGQDFSGIYLKQIGSYETGKAKEWIEDRNSIFELGQNLDQKNNTREYFFNKQERYINIAYTIHLIIYNDDNEILNDNIYHIKESDKFTTLISTDLTEDSGFEYWIFDNDSNLIDRQYLTFYKNFSVSSSIIEGEYILSKEIFSKKNPLSKEDRKIQIHTSTSHQRYNQKTKLDIKNINRQLYNRIKDLNEKDDIKKYGKWFKKENFQELIDFFNEITMNGQYKLIFIDPFISSSSCLDYLYHFKNTNISLEFISCWAKDISPDDDKKRETEAEHIENFKNILDNIQDYKLPLKNTIWYNFREKSFHDRFLYVEDSSKQEVSIYSISNSLNNLLSNYENLSIVPLHGNVFIQAKDYIQNNLLPKCNDSNKIYPVVSE